MDEDKEQIGQQYFHSTSVFTNLHSFFRKMRKFAEENEAFAEYPPFRAGFGLIIGSFAQAYTKTFAR